MANFKRADEGLRELALLAGAGGGILGGHLLGWRTVCAVEWEPYAASVLAARQNDGLLPAFPIWDDVQTFDGRPWRGCVDVVSGGFPCQDISVAGKGAGIDGKRSGMWGHMARIVGEVRPRYVFVENSPALLVRGLGRVLGDLAAIGYDCKWTVLGAADVGAPHQRDRFWLVARDANSNHESSIRAISSRRGPDSCGVCEVADTTDARFHQRRRPDGLGEDVRLMGGDEWNGLQGIREEEGDVLANADSLRQLQPKGSECNQRGRVSNGGKDVADTTSERQPSERDSGKHSQTYCDRQASRLRGDGQMDYTNSAQCERRWLPIRTSTQHADIGVTSWWQSEPDVGRVANGVAARVDRLKAIGNGQVPLCAATAWKLLTQ